MKLKKILSRLGLSASEAILLLYRQIQMRRGLPFAVAIPNELTARTLRASKLGKNVKTFGSRKELYADLGL